jgi:hypothetical protein
MWTARATALLRAESPHALVSVEGCVASLSGFVVVVHERPEPPHLAQRIALVLLVGMASLLGGAGLMRGVQDELLGPTLMEAARDALGWPSFGLFW